jgi:hypothetical protein
MMEDFELFMDFVRKILPQELRLMIRGLYFIGGRVGCPSCGWSFRRYMNNPRPSRWPRCWSLERHRLIWLYLRHRTDFFTRPARLLHFAPEYCFLRTFRSLRHLDYVTADLCAPRAKIKMDICDITFEDNSFDVIICSHVLEHVQNDRKAMSELCRVLKPGGWAILQTPFDPKRTETYEDLTVTSRRPASEYSASTIMCVSTEQITRIGW